MIKDQNNTKEKKIAIHLFLPKIAHRIIELYKTKNGLKNKQEAVESIIMSFEKEFSKEELNSDWRNDPASIGQLNKIEELTGKEAPKGMSKYEAQIIIKSYLRTEDFKKPEQKIKGTVVKDEQGNEVMLMNQKKEDFPDY